MPATRPFRIRIRQAIVAGLLALAGLVSTPPVPAAATRPTLSPQTVASLALPARLSDAEFWTLVADISEPGGYFRITDNFTSNEREVGRLQTMLRDAKVQGGVYLGVGPEQNFSYISAIHPAMAFIVDIRRQAVVQHLMFKAIFELAPDRADFISLLFSKPRPSGLDRATPIQRMWDAFAPVATDRSLADKTYARIVDRLTKTHRIILTSEESGQLESVFQAFVQLGPSISTRGAPGGFGGGNGVTFADLTGWSLDAADQPQSFLSTDENYQYVKSLQEKNLVVPASGDFGGPKTIRAIGAYLHEHRATLSAFYVSNVEQYLFMDGKEREFYDNVATLPLSDTSVFIRPYSLRQGGGAAQSLCPIARFVAAASAGRVRSNYDALACPR
jgi:hypothetical protein